MRQLGKYTPSLEGVEVEIERVFYGTLVNFDELKNASDVFIQEQYMCFARKDDREQQFRTRRTVKNGRTTYEFTIKYVNRGGGSRTEINIPIEKDVFESYKNAAFEGYLKERYIFPVNQKIKWELDLFYDRNGKPIEVVKLDLEVPNLNYPVPDWPVTLKDPFESKGYATNPDLVSLYDRFNLLN